MWLLLGTTLTISFFDSLNPSAIAQQMLLQAMVKNKRHILFFILGIGLANFIMGLAIYYGIASFVSLLLSHLTKNYPIYVYGTAMGAGIFCILAGIRLIIKTKISSSVNDELKEQETVKTPMSLSPVSLFIMGVAFCFVELTSAFPYFGFIALLAQYKLFFPVILIFMLIYNFMYVFPLILLYNGYNKLKGTKMIKKIEFILEKISSYIIPVVIVLVGIVLAYYGVSSLL